MNKHNLRPVEQPDTEDLHMFCWPDEAFDDSIARVETAIKSMERGKGLALIARLDEKTIAFGQVNNWGSRWEISDLIVAPGFRSRGIGADILQSLIQHGREENPALIEIGVNDDNTMAKKLYEKLGFTEAYRILSPSQPNHEIIYLQLEPMTDEG